MHRLRSLDDQAQVISGVMKAKLLFSIGIALLCSLLTPLDAQKGDEETVFEIGKCRVFFQGFGDAEGLATLKKATLEKGLTFKTSKGDIKIADLKLQQQKERWINTLLYLGYLDAKLSLHVDDGGKLPKIDVAIRSGPLYAIKELEILVNDGPLPQHLRHLVPQLPCAAKTPLIQDALGKILNAFESGGYPFAKIESQVFDVIGSSADLQARVLINTGPFCLFGDYKISGAMRVSRRFIDQRMRIMTNAPFDLHQVAKSRRELEASGLFNSVTIGLERREETPSGPYFIDLDVGLTEGKCRSYGVGLSQTISRGIGSGQKWNVGIRTEWSHRNLKGMGESININALISRPRRNITLQYAEPVETKRPHIQAQLRVAGSIEQDRARGFDATSWTTGVYLDHQFGTSFNFSKGLKIEQIATHGELKFPRTSLLAFPLSFTWSSASDLLDPRNGAKCSLLLSPLMDWSPQRRFFTKQELQLARYIPLKKMTLALSAQFANFWGVRWDQVPPSLRYFLGSSNSMRGYAYKSLSPLDARAKPTGGSSMLALTIEPRIRLNPHFTLVPFFEWGRIYLTDLPKGHLPLLRSAGLGAYIHTPIGPLRLDCATPLDKRRGLDRPLQIYMSLGSAF